ncbi:MAG: hypothetical protein ACLP0H_19590 [Terriglobales bacterium]
MYSTFPGSLPGAGLLLLRITIGVGLLIHALSWLIEPQTSNNGMWAPGLLALVIGISFILVFLTPLAGSVSALAGMAIHWLHPEWSASMTGLLGWNPLFVVIAVTLLGPGAFSLDAYFFGRRRIVVPRVTNTYGFTWAFSLRLRAPACFVECVPAVDAY